VLVFSCPPGGDEGGADFLVRPPITAGNNRIRETLEHDERCGARRMGRREQRRGSKRSRDSDENRLAAAEIVEYRGDAVGPLLQGGHRIRRDGIRCSGAWLIQEDQSAERRHCLDPTLQRR
jgi:hypothetical protein